MEIPLTQATLYLLAIVILVMVEFYGVFYEGAVDVGFGEVIFLSKAT